MAAGAVAALAAEQAAQHAGQPCCCWRCIWTRGLPLGTAAMAWRAGLLPVLLLLFRWLPLLLLRRLTAPDVQLQPDSLFCAR